MLILYNYEKGSFIMFTLNLIVRFNDCDPMGHVNNAVYFTYFEEARAELFQLFNPNLNTRQWNLIVAGARCDYIKEALYSETLTIFTWVGKIGNSSFDVEHAIQNEKGEWVARGKGTLLGYDFISKKAVPLTEEIKEHLKVHSEAPNGCPGLRGEN